VGSGEGKVYALDGATGAKRWEFTTGASVCSSPAIGADGTVYVGSYDHKVYALDGATGAKRWEFTTGGVVYSSPAIGADGTVYVGSGDGKVYALDGASGAKRWEFNTVYSVSSSPAIGADGTVYVGSGNNKVYALDGATGAERWEFATGASVCSSPAIGADGTVYVGSGDGKVYAIKGSGPLAESAWPMFHQNVRHSGRAGPLNSVPRITSITLSGGTAAVSVLTLSGRLYALEFKGTLSSVPWTSLSAVFGDGTVLILRDAVGTSASRFYRVRME
jgi:outer membrane protein assembly factor BamB